MLSGILLVIYLKIIIFTLFIVFKTEAENIKELALDISKIILFIKNPHQLSVKRWLLGGVIFGFDLSFFYFWILIIMFFTAVATLAIVYSLAYSL